MTEADDPPPESPVTDDASGWFAKRFMAPDGVVRSRLAICAKCEHFNQTTKFCGICHCVMPFKAKMAGTKCPKGKWHPFVRPPKLGHKF